MDLLICESVRHDFILKSNLSVIIRVVFVIFFNINAMVPNPMEGRQLPKRSDSGSQREPESRCPVFWESIRMIFGDEQ